MPPALHRRNVLRFLGRFAGLLILYYALTLWGWVDEHALFPLLKFTARLASGLLNLFGSDTMTQGVVIQGKGFSIAVRRGCDPAEPIMLFGTAVMAFPGSFRRKLPGFLLGAVVLFAINLIRIASLYWVGKSYPAWFDALHQEWWPAAYIFTAVLLWLLWLRWAAKSPIPQHA